MRAWGALLMGERAGYCSVLAPFGKIFLTFVDILLPYTCGLFPNFT